MIDSNPQKLAPLTAVGLSISEAKGEPHQPAAQLRMTPNGIDGDRHAGPGPRQVASCTGTSSSPIFRTRTTNNSRQGTGEYPGGR